MHKKGQFIVKRAAPEEGVKIWETQAGTFREEIILGGSRTNVLYSEKTCSCLW